MKKERAVKRAHKRMQEYWSKEQSLKMLLIVLVVYIFLIIPLIHRNVSGQIVFFVFYFLLLSSGWPFLKDFHMPWLIWLLILFPFAFLFNELYTLALWERVAADLFIIGYCLLLCWILLRRTFAEGPITGYRIQGSIAVYLLIAFSFAMMFHAVTLLEGTSAFKGSITSFDNYKEYMYFSLTTLTTTGYGDIVPAVSTSRSLANLEALIGQLYPAILIARLVSLQLVSSHR
jgi:hypothetical protein